MQHLRSHIQKVVQIGFGVAGPYLGKPLTDLIERDHEALRHPAPTRHKHLDALPLVVDEPEVLGPFAEAAFAAENSAHRPIMNAYAKHNGPAPAKAAAAFLALPPACVGAKVYVDAIERTSEFRQRLFLGVGTLGRTPPSLQEAFARKALPAAARLAIQESMQRGLWDYRIARVAPSVTDTMRVLVTIRDHIEHGAAQGNCIGDEVTLTDVARGTKLYAEVVDDDGAVCSVSLIRDSRTWRVERAERANNLPVGKTRLRRLAAHVEPLIHAAVGKRKKR